MLKQLLNRLVENSRESKRARVQKEVLALHYGVLVSEMVKVYDGNTLHINTALKNLGIAGGHSMIEEILSEIMGIEELTDSMQTFFNLLEIVMYYGMKLHFGISADCIPIEGRSEALYIVLHDNPLETFVNVPLSMKSTLHYSNLIVGIIQGCLEGMNVVARCEFVRSGANQQFCRTILVTFIKYVKITEG